MELQYLPWDSDFFKMKIGRIDCQIDEIEAILANKNDYTAQGYNLLYIFTPHSLKSTLSFNPIDTKRVYCKEIKSGTQDTHKIELYDGAPKNLYNLAYQSGFDSRYRLDDRFKEGEFERLYRIWIDNSINRKIADAVFVSKFDGEISGFITLSVKDDMGSIGLLATDKKYRGQGIGTSLIDKCSSYLFGHQIPKLTVATQLTNQNACHFYEKCGMSVLDEQDIYHLWL